MNNQPNGETLNAAVIELGKITDPMLCRAKIALQLAAQKSPSALAAEASKINVQLMHGDYEGEYATASQALSKLVREIVL